MAVFNLGDVSAGVAQSVEQRSEKPCVDGSIPPPGTVSFLYVLFLFVRSLFYILWR